MGLSSGHAALTFIIASLQALLDIAENPANPLQNDHVFRPNLSPRPPKKFQVGDKYGRGYGYDYAAWALKNAPFYVNDTVVFNYEVPYFNDGPQSVSLVPDLESMLKCDYSKANLVANVMEGEFGFEFVLNTSSPYYFVSPETGALELRRRKDEVLHVAPTPSQPSLENILHFFPDIRTVELDGYLD